MTDRRERRDDRGTYKRQGTVADRRAPNWTVWLFGLLVIVVIVGGVVVLALFDTQQEQGRLLRIQRSALLGSCKRLQVERDRVNVNDAAVYLTLSNAQTNPTNPPKVRARYQRLAEAASWSPPADCVRAIKDPDHYLPPPPIPYHCLVPDGFAVSLVRGKILNDVRTRRGRPPTDLPRPADVIPGCPASLPGGLPGG